MNVPPHIQLYCFYQYVYFTQTLDILYNKEIGIYVCICIYKSIMKCKHCDSENMVKAGFVNQVRGKRQRWQCLECRRYTLEAV